MSSTKSKSCVILSIPRCGTHALMQILSSLGTKEFSPLGKRDNFWECWGPHLAKIPSSGFYCFGNHPYPSEHVKLEQAGLVGIFISRDPRDWVVSYSHFYKNASFLRKFYEKEGMTGVIGKVIGMIPQQFRRLSWRDHWPNVFSTTYERMFENSEVEIGRICSFLNLSVEEKTVKTCIQNLKNGPPQHPKVFRKGIVGDWRNYFTLEHIKLFKNVAGQLLIKEGYEKDMNW